MHFYFWFLKELNNAQMKKWERTKCKQILFKTWCLSMFIYLSCIEKWLVNIYNIYIIYYIYYIHIYIYYIYIYIYIYLLLLYTVIYTIYILFWYCKRYFRTTKIKLLVTVVLHTWSWKQPSWVFRYTVALIIFGSLLEKYRC